MMSHHVILHKKKQKVSGMPFLRADLLEFLRMQLEPNFNFILLTDDSKPNDRTVVKEFCSNILLFNLRFC